ncbi:MAG: AMP-binding protein [Candidatus Nanopelagicales bacterium]
MARAAVGPLDPFGRDRGTTAYDAPLRAVHRPPTETAMVFPSPLPPVTPPETTITDFVLASVDEHPDKPALVDGPTGRVLTYAGLAEAIRSLAGGLVARGLAPGEVVALMAPNCPEFAVALHGVVHAGGVVTTINPTYTSHEVQRQLADSGATRVITVGALLGTVTQARDETAVTEVYVLEPDGVDGAASFTSLFGAPLPGRVAVSLDDTALLPYSSGTTGLTKGVRLSHRNLVSNICQAASVLGFTGSDTSIAVLPFFHAYGLQILMNMGLNAGATVVTMPRFDLEQFLSLHQQYGVTRSFVAPPIVLALAKHPLVDSYDLSSLTQIISGAAPLSAELADEAAARIGCEVIQGYGMTELTTVAHLPVPGGSKPGSVGVPAPSTETKIIDPGTGAEVAIGTDGEICIRGPQVMLGYLNNESATRDMVEPDGWLHTGDIGHLDDDGHLYVVDRLKELIKYKGFQVPPAELEAVLLTHPDVADAAVIGVPDEEAGEIPVAHVVLKPGRTATEDDISAFVAERVATYKRLGGVVFTDAIPKSASGKILRRQLRDQ